MQVRKMRTETDSQKQMESNRSRETKKAPEEDRPTGKRKKLVHTLKDKRQQVDEAACQAQSADSSTLQRRETGRET